MATDHIRYDLLVQDALRGVFRKVMQDVAANGLPGEHHFYITFKTGAPGVKMSDRLRAQYPDVMTIILQHQFWDLTVDDNAFGVGLSFRQIPEKLHVPFAAVTGFFDPSVNFGAEFAVDEAAAGDLPALRPVAPLSEPAAAQPKAAPDRKGADKSVEKPAAKARPAQSEKSESAPARPRGGASEPKVVPAAEEAAADSSPKVVSIDAFRKKTP
ncbi:MAG: Stringent starvation protein B [Hyphomicrobiales bacterium]|nr:Stringent starvation protein B [Hyphomicrobiales bacterium]